MLPLRFAVGRARKVLTINYEICNCFAFQIMKDDLKDLDKLSDELICRVEVVLESAEPGRDRDAFESRFEDMKTRWKAVKEKVATRQREVEQQTPVLYNYHEKMTDFFSWITDLESKLSSLSPVSCDTKMIAKQLQQVEALKVDYCEHKPDYESVKNVSAEVIDNQPDDVYVVEAQLEYVNKLWDSVTLRLMGRLDQINTVKEIASEYLKAERPVRALFAWVEDAIAPLEAIGSNIERAKQELNNTKVINAVSVVRFQAS